MLNQPKGFSLIELMIVLALVAILMAVAIPSFVDMTQRNRISTEVNALVGDLQFARSEAITRGASVSICASSTGTTCLAKNTWQLGWIVFSNVKGTGVVETGDIVLRVRPAWPGGDTLTAAPATTAITYSRDGFTALPGDASGKTLMTLHTSATNTSATRCIAINRVGYQKIYKYGESSCI